MGQWAWESMLCDAGRAGGQRLDGRVGVLSTECYAVACAVAVSASTVSSTAGVIPGGNRIADSVVALTRGWGGLQWPP